MKMVGGIAPTLALALVCALTPAGVGMTAPALQVNPTQSLPAPDSNLPRPNINPYDRDIALTVPLNFNRRVLGELPVILTKDDRFIVQSNGFISLISPLLTPEAQAALVASLDGIDRFAPEEINAAGIQLDYDPDQLAVLVLRIEPSMRVPEMLFQGGQAEAPASPPENFSAYLNTNLAFQYYHANGDAALPSVALNGAWRYKSLVFEADFQGRDSPFDDEYSVDRRYARFVLDQPEAHRRWYFGDLEPDVRGRQGFVEMGGIGVSRQVSRFESFRNNVLTGSRQLVLQEASTVRIQQNGVFVREFQLEAGQYDLKNLPLETGSNDVRIEVENSSGRQEVISYSAYLDNIDLEPGDYEYGAYLGLTSRSFFGTPDYSSGDLAFTGFYRKAFLNKPAIGVGFQASEFAQTITAQTQFILTNGARLQLDTSASNSEAVGAGYSVAVGYDHVLDFGMTADAWSVVVDYVSEDFATIGNPLANNHTSWSISSGYSRRFTPRWLGNINAAYRVPRDGQSDASYSINASTTYRISPEWSTQLGVEYSNLGTSSGLSNRSNEELGISLSLVWTPSYNRRADMRYASSRDSGSIRYQHIPQNSVNSLGYSVASTYNAGSASLSGQVDFSGNRFDASLAHASFGTSFSDITTDQVTSLRFGSSIATTGGKVAIGRQIYDSFAIVYPHESLKDHPVIVGESFERGRYTSKSGVLGPALSNTLTSYVNQSVRYDALNAPLGYDVGEGVRRVRPSYRSGYAIEVGSDSFVSAIGRLVGYDNKPLPLMSGHVRPTDQPDAEPTLFFTNSVGRFAIQNLTPGKSYRVEVFSSPSVSVEFTVPEENQGLLDLGLMSVPLTAPDAP